MATMTNRPPTNTWNRWMHPETTDLAPPQAHHVTGVGQLCITVEDLDRAQRFYQTVVGLRLLFRLPTMAFFDCGGIRLMLALPEHGSTARHASIIYYVVGDIHGAHRALAERGARFESAPHKIASMETHDLWMAFLRDSEGNLLGLMSEVAPQP